MRTESHLCRLLYTLVFLSALLAVNPVAGQAATSAQVQGLSAIEITVSDMDRAVDFYSRALSFRKTSDVEVSGKAFEHLEGVLGPRVHIVRMQLGQEQIELEEFLVPKGVPIPTDSRSNDRWFQHIAIVVSDMEAAFDWLRHNKVQFVSSSPQTLPAWNKSAGGIRAFYFKDPDGHPLEILQFPPDKGDPKWQLRSRQLFLGIDHTAIVVADTEASLRFYRDVLGMRVVGESENYGPEQEHLSSVVGARLRITALRASSGPGIELLDYLAPRNGRPFFANDAADDLVRRETEIVCDNLPSAFATVAAAHATLISPGLVDLSPALGYTQAFELRDPDGHVIRLHNRVSAAIAKAASGTQTAKKEPVQ